MEYLDFELEIGRHLEQRATARRSVYSVAVLRSPQGAGEPRGEMTFPLVGEQRELQLLRVQNALLRSGVGANTRRISPSGEKPIQEFGETLFNALFDGAIGSCYDFARRTAETEGKGLRLKLRILDPALAAMPWEFLYDPRGSGSFLALSPETPLIRYVEVPRALPTLALEPPLRVLGVIASPTDLPRLDVSLEKRRVEKSLQGLIERGQVELTWLDGQTWQDLRSAMWSSAWHVFHFIGHGDFDASSDEGVLALADEQGQSQLLTATQVSRLLSGQATLRLALLNSCDGAKGSNRDLFSSTAVTLVSAGISAVVAMQYEISDAAAIEFGSSFYNAIAHGIPVDAAVAEARIAISMGAHDTAEWGIPVLHMRTPTGQIFDLKPGTGKAAPPTERPSEAAVRSPSDHPALAPPPLVTPARRVNAGKSVWVAAVAALLLAGLLGAVLLSQRSADTRAPAAATSTSAETSASSACVAIGSSGPRCTVLSNLVGHKGAVWGLSFSSDGTGLLSTGYEDPPAIVWKAPPGAPAGFAQKASYRGDPAPGVSPPPIVSAAWSPSSPSVVATGALDGTVHVWDAATAQDTFTPDGRANDDVASVAWDAAGTFLAAGSWDSSVRLWAPGASPVPRTMPPASAAGRVYALAWLTSDANGGVVAVGVQDGRILLWDTRSDATTAIPPDGKAVAALAWSSVNGVLASGTEDGAVHTWIQQSQEYLRLDSTHAGAVHSVAWSTDGKLLASGGDEGVVKLWRWTGSRAALIGEIDEKRQAVFALAWSGQSSAGADLLAIGRQDHQIELVQIAR